jgi:hypothetical protein
MAPDGQTLTQKPQPVQRSVSITGWRWLRMRMARCVQANSQLMQTTPFQAMQAS